MIHAICDFCGHSKEVIRTNYGTSHYVRLICSECRKQIEKGEGISVQNMDEKKGEEK